MKKYFAAATIIFANLSYAFMPQSGAWGINSETNGKPGRGLVIDAQNGIVAVQMYAYEPSGQPTFFLGVGELKDNSVTTTLNRYSGGRSFGSSPRDAVEAGSPGKLKIRFTSGVTGYVTLPNEGELAISRLNFGYPFEAASLKGIWSMTSIGSDGIYSDAVLLSVPGERTSNGNGLMSSADGLFGCEHQIKGELAGSVLCAKINSSGALQRGYIFVYSVNDGEGIAFNQYSPAEQMLSVRRLTTDKGVGTGIVYQNTMDEKEPHPELYKKIEEIAQGGNSFIK